MQKALSFLTRFSGGVSGCHIISLKVIYTYFSSKCTRISSKTPLQTTISKNSHSSHKDTIYFFLEKPGNKITTSQIVQISLWELHFSTAKSTVTTTQRSWSLTKYNSAITNRYKVQCKNNRDNTAEKRILTTQFFSIPFYMSKILSRIKKRCFKLYPQNLPLENRVRKLWTSVKRGETENLK